MNYPDNIDAIDDTALGEWITANGLNAPSSAEAHLAAGSPAQRTLDTPMPLSGLPPHMREPIEAKLAHVPWEKREEAARPLVAEALRNYSIGQRIRAGVGSEANAYQRALFEMESEDWQNEREVERISDLLAEVDRFDPATGKGIHRVEGQRRTELHNELNRLMAARERWRVERPAKLAKAKDEAISDIRAQRQALKDHAEIKRRTEEALREKHIQQQVDTKVRLATNTYTG